MPFPLQPRSTPIRGFGTVCLIAATVTAAATPAFALRHLRLVRTYPAADTVLAKTPDAIRLWLSERAELPSVKITLTEGAGKAVPLARPTLAAPKGAPIQATIPTALAAGSYAVTWRAMSRDGHVVQGNFAFRVGSPK